MKPKAVAGLFHTISDAQQAVQLLLGNDFVAEHISISEQPVAEAADRKGQASTAEERSTGRFLSSLFGRMDETGSTESEVNASSISGTLVTVQVQTPLEADQVIGLLKRAGAVKTGNVD